MAPFSCTHQAIFRPCTQAQMKSSHLTNKTNVKVGVARKGNMSGGVMRERTRGMALFSCTHQGIFTPCTQAQMTSSPKPHVSRTYYRVFEGTSTIETGRKQICEEGGTWFRRPCVSENSARQTLHRIRPGPSETRPQDMLDHAHTLHHPIGVSKSPTPK